MSVISPILIRYFREILKIDDIDKNKIIKISKDNKIDIDKLELDYPWTDSDNQQVLDYINKVRIFLY